MKYLSNIKDIVDLYKNAINIENWNNDSFCLSLKSNKGLPLKKVNISSILNGFEIISIKKFILKYGEVYILPIHDLIAIRAFFFRSINEKDFRLVPDGRPFFYGLHRFKDFKYNQTIFLTEGIKDCEAIALSYPFCLVLLSNRLTYNQKEILKRLSNNIVYIHDSDYYGRRGGISVNKNIKILSNPVGKDLGELFEENCEEKENIKLFIESVIKNFT